MLGISIGASASSHDVRLPIPLDFELYYTDQQRDKLLEDIKKEGLWS